jgi:N-acetyl-gamma-glutamyl-phosphate reductase
VLTCVSFHHNLFLLENWTIFNSVYPDVSGDIDEILLPRKESGELMHTIFIDGQAGTTGLQIHQRLKDRNDINLIEIPENERKDPVTKQQFLNDADIVILCLPDAAAKESAAMIDNPDTRVIDASTAHRTDPQWIYGMPELCPMQRDEIKKATRVTNPGCYATGFVLLVRPLVENAVITPDYPLSCTAVSGYSGAGKKMIAQFDGPPEASAARFGSRFYALSLQHKHIPEMRKHSGLAADPIFLPAVCDYYSGMTCTIPLHKKLLASSATPETLHELYSSWYSNEPFLHVQPLDLTASLDDGFLNPVNRNGTNHCDLFVFGDEERIVVATRFDNLGKGASGAAVQNMNLIMGIDETTGL